MTQLIGSRLTRGGDVGVYGGAFKNQRGAAREVWLGARDLTRRSARAPLSARPAE